VVDAVMNKDLIPPTTEHAADRLRAQARLRSAAAGSLVV